MAAVKKASKASKRSTLTVDGREVSVSNLDKVLYPKSGFTKSDVIHYYVKVAPVLLPHLKERPLTLKRYPNGVEGAFFYEKRCPSHRPDWVRTAPIWSEGSGANIDFCIAGDLPTLVWAANLADLELHTYLHRAKAPEKPTVLVFDLDPGPPATILQCCQVALWIRKILERNRLQCFPKTSGSKGLQIYTPLNPGATYDQTKPVARQIADALTEEHPDLVTSTMSKSLRRGKVFVDWSQNDSHKTTVAVYSLRAKEQPTVSTPLAWSEVEQALKQGDQAALSFLWNDVLQRVEKQGDLFEPVLKLRQRLPKNFRTET